MFGNKHHIFAFKFAFVSMLVLGGSILTIKKFADSPQKNTSNIVTNFNLSKVKKIKLKQKTNKVKKQRQKIRRRMKALKPALTASVSGNSFGMQLDDIGNVDLDNALLSDGEDVIMDENSVDSKPKVRERTKIEFPEKALAKNIMKGIVEIRMLINKDGRVENAEILSANPKGYFEEATLAMIQDWVFEPAMYRGKSVGIWAKQVVKYGE